MDLMTSYGGSLSDNYEMTKLQQTNEVLNHDVMRILDNKQRIESENFLLKKEIQRIRDQNLLLNSKLDGKQLASTSILSATHDSQIET